VAVALRIVGPNTFGLFKQDSWQPGIEKYVCTLALPRSETERGLDRMVARRWLDSFLAQHDTQGLVMAASHLEHISKNVNLGI